MKVKLIYFKRNGKYYAESQYITEYDSLTDIWLEVESFAENNRLPGLITSDFIVLIDVPDHKYNHPKLVL